MSAHLTIRPSQKLGERFFVTMRSYIGVVPPAGENRRAAQQATTCSKRAPAWLDGVVRVARGAGGERLNHQVVSSKSSADTPAMPGMLRKSTAFLPRYQKFESISLQGRACKLSVP